MGHSEASNGGRGRPRRCLADVVSVSWALGGTCLLFAAAAARLSARGVQTVRDGLEAWQWGVLLILVLLFLVGEG